MTPENNSVPKLSVCPALIPDRIGRKFTFLESVLVARDKLKEGLAVTRFLDEMLIWAGRDENKSERYLQNVLNAYYLVGLIPYICFTNSHNQSLVSTLIESNNLQEVRHFCLSCLTERLNTMSRFWSIAFSLGSFNTHVISQSVDITYEDAKRRIRLLRNLGALQKAGNEYRLSLLGSEFASSIETSFNYEVSPSNIRLNEVNTDEYSFTDFVDW